MKPVSNSSLDCLSNASLIKETRRIRNFYREYSVTSAQGFHQSIDVHGRTKDETTHHLVSSCRLTINFCRTAMLLEDKDDLTVAQMGLDFIESAHKRDDGRGYHWLLQDGDATDTDQYCYGYAFLILTFSNAYKAGIEGAKPLLEATHELMDQYFWEPQFGLYADQFSLDSNSLLPYRGQNANMHACEAFISAYDATGERRYLNRALELATHIVKRQTQSTDGMIWEHYTTAWIPDFDYNREDPKNLYKPWGYQPGHFTEWAKLLLILHYYEPQAWLKQQASFLLNSAFEVSWDSEHGGLFYGFAPDRSICDDDKYFWVQAETLAALVLASSKLDEPMLDRISQLQHYINKHFIVAGTGVWRRVLNSANVPEDDWVALPGAKCDYHTLGSYHDILRFGGID